MFTKADQAKRKSNRSRRMSLAVIASGYSVAIIVAVFAMTGYASAAPADVAGLATMLAAPDLTATSFSKLGIFITMAAGLGVMLTGSVAFASGLKNDFDQSAKRLAV